MGGPCVFHFPPNRMKENAEAAFFSSGPIIELEDAAASPQRELEDVWASLREGGCIEITLKK